MIELQVLGVRWTTVPFLRSVGRNSSGCFSLDDMLVLTNASLVRPFLSRSRLLSSPNQSVSIEALNGDGVCGLKKICIKTNGIEVR